MAKANLSVFCRQLTRGMAAESLNDESDRQLVEHFLARRDESAFEAILRRHGPMVYRVCWRVLQQAEDAEDAFQATFLLLAQKLQTVRRRDSLASWLHGVAHRLALKAGAQAVTRRRRECLAPAPRAVPPDEVTWGELRTVLDAELQRLPEKWRLPLILCYLEGRTHDEATRQLGWGKNTLRRRLEEAREALGRRLTGRGVVWPAVLSSVLLSDCAALATLRPGLVGPIVEAATRLAARQAALPTTVSAGVAALAQGERTSMFLTQLKIVTGVMLVLTLAGAGIGVIGHRLRATEPGETKKQEAPAATAKPAADQGSPESKPAEGQDENTDVLVKDAVKQFYKALRAEDAEALLEVAGVPWWWDETRITNDRDELKKQFQVVFDKQDLANEWDEGIEVRLIAPLTKFEELVQKKFPDDRRKKLEEFLGQDHCLVSILVERGEQHTKGVLAVRVKDGKAKVVGFVESGRIIKMVIGPGVRGADDKDTGAKLSLSSGYGYGLLWDKARSVHLSATLDDKGEGKGTLALDPNLKGFDQFGDMTSTTQIAVRELQVTFEEVKGKNQPKDGRRLYEIKGHGLDNRLFLVVPAKGGTTYRIVSADKEGKGQAVLLLEAQAAPGK